MPVRSRDSRKTRGADGTRMAASVYVQKPSLELQTKLVLQMINTTDDIGGTLVMSTDETGALSRDEVRRRLPEVEFIEQSALQSQTITALQEGVLDYFWNAPATSHSALHNPMCRETRGLWIHPKMVAVAYERLAPSFLEQGRIDRNEVDYGRIACLLHDIRKYGTRYTPGSKAAPDHDVQAAEWVRRNTDFDDRVAEAIATHMGPFDRYAGPPPQTGLQHLVHNSDMMGSHRFGTMWLYRPAEELVEQYPDAETFTDKRLPWEK